MWLHSLRASQRGILVHGERIASSMIPAEPSTEQARFTVMMDLTEQRGDSAVASAPPLAPAIWYILELSFLPLYPV